MGKIVDQKAKINRFWKTFEIEQSSETDEPSIFPF